MLTEINYDPFPMQANLGYYVVFLYYVGYLNCNLLLLKLIWFNFIYL